ncbi:hypothetical protein [Kribbella sp. NPDC051770]|uniref:hypothetical protein n=1 Tax=Kribbella sp. NPDC051770 TaxID=3155413 RepID=UPI003439D437
MAEPCRFRLFCELFAAADAYCFEEIHPLEHGTQMNTIRTIARRAALTAAAATVGVTGMAQLAQAAPASTAGSCAVLVRFQGSEVLVDNCDDSRGQQARVTVRNNAIFGRTEISFTLRNGDGFVTSARQKENNGFIEFHTPVDLSEVIVRVYNFSDDNNPAHVSAPVPF